MTQTDLELVIIAVAYLLSGYVLGLAVAEKKVCRQLGCRRYPPSENVRGGWYDKGTNTQPPPPPPPPPAPPPITEGCCRGNTKCEHFREMPKGPPPPLRPVPPTNLRIKSGVIPTAEEVLARRPPEAK